jgi:hypothetical protein
VCKCFAARILFIPRIFLMYLSLLSVSQLFETYYLISENSDIFLSQSTTYFKISDDAISDASGNKVVGISIETALQIGPAIMGWDIDLNTGIVVLFFSEPVASGFVPLGLSIQDEYTYNALTSTSVTLTTSEVVATVALGDSLAAGEISTPDRTFSFQLNSVDMNLLKSSGLAAAGGKTGHHSLFLAADAGVATGHAVSDALLPELPSVELRRSSAKSVRKFVADTTPPTCLSFGLNLNTGTLSLLFDEPVNPLSLLPLLLTLLSSTNGTFVNLPADSVLSSSIVNYVQLEVALSSTATNQIKKMTHVGGILDRLLLRSGAIADLLGNFIGNGGEDVSPARVTMDPLLYVPDTSPPSLVSWILDRTTWLLTLTFDEALAADSFSPSQVLLASHADSLASGYTSIRLSNRTVINQDNAAGTGLIIGSSNIQLDMQYFLTDALMVQKRTGLAVNTSNAFVVVTDIRDLFGNHRPGPVVLQASKVVQDTGRPELVAFDYLLASAPSTYRLRLYFSEVMSIDDFNAGDFELVTSRVATSPLSINMGSGTVTSTVSDDVLEVLLTVSNEFAAAIETDGPFLAAPPTPLSKDMNGNLLQSINADSAALQPGPQILRFSLNVNTRELMIVSENICIGEFCCLHYGENVVIVALMLENGTIHATK